MANKRPALTLRPDAADLVNAYQVGEHLSGRLASLRTEGGRPLSGAELDATLRAFGVGEHRITVSGTFQPFTGPLVEVLPEWSEHMTIAGGLDAGSVGRAAHVLARQFRNAEAAALAAQGITETPPEVFVLEVRVEAVKLARPPRWRVRRGRQKKTGEVVGVPRKRYVLYRDTKTGQLVGADTWKRSRAAIRARTPKGKRAKPGRYVQEIVWR